MKTLEERIEDFKLKVDDDKEFINLPLDEFVKNIALTPSEKKEASKLLKELK